MSVMAEPKPEVDYDQHTPPECVCGAYRHEDGSITYIVDDDDRGGDCNPRENDGNVATLINGNDRNIDIDTDDAGLTEARKRFDCYGRRGTSAHGYAHGTKVRLDRDAMMQRYLAMFRPDILHYADWWSAGREGYGWGYVTKEAWEKHVLPEKPYGDTDEAKLAWVDYEPRCTPEEAFDAEVKVYGQWAEGEVYGYVHVSVGEPIIVLGDHGAYVDGYDTEEDSCWGFLGYDDHQEIAREATDSPITEVLH